MSKRANLKTSMLLGVTVLLILTSLILLLFTDINECYILPIVFVTLIFVYVIIHYHKKNVQYVDIDLMPKIYKLIERILPPFAIVFFLMFFPQKSFAIVSIFMLYLVISLVIDKRLVISDNGIRYIYRWSLKWDDIQSYRFDNEKGILFIQLKDNSNEKKVSGINEKNYSLILTSINRFNGSVSI
jgi:hypothetical protein